MTTAKALARLSEPKLRAWILARMREDHVDPPIAESRLESLDDYVRLVYQETDDEKFRAKIEKAALAALGEVAEGDLRAGPDARAARNLAALVDGLDLDDAAPVLQAIAERGAFGGNEGGLDPAAEEMVLFALAGLQTPGKLWAKWEALWQQKSPRLWPVVTAGLRLSNAKKALGILPEAVRRAASHAEFPLGEVLWAFATEEQFDSKDIAPALKGLSPEERKRCREALSALGAEQDEIDEWVPIIETASPALLPWMCKVPPMPVPRLGAHAWR